MNSSDIFTVPLSNVPESLCKMHYLICDFWEDHSSPAVKGSFNSPFFILLIIAIYNVGVLYVGPALMAKRKPVDVGRFMKWYNYINIVVNSFIFTIGLYFTRWTYDGWFCQEFRDTYTLKLTMYGGLLFIFLKIFDLLDTVLFVLRKKSNQITLLHVTHHSIMPFTSYLFVKHIMTPSICIVPICNSFVHAVMYYYYQVSSQGRQVWWKKHITHIQLLQFIIVWIHGFHTLFIDHCSFPPWVASLEMMEATYFFISFSRFYFRAYKTNDKKTRIDFNNNYEKVKVLKED